MNEKYYKDMFGGIKYGDYMVYGLDKSKESTYSDYTDLLDQMCNYYNATSFTEESEEQKAIREYLNDKARQTGKSNVTASLMAWHNLHSKYERARTRKESIKRLFNI